MPDILLVFERQILRKTFRPIQSKEGLRIRNNKKLQKLIKSEDIVRYITAQIIKWLGHLNRRENTELVKKITEWNPTGVRTKRRSKDKWRDGVIKDLKTLKLRHWSQIVIDIKVWNDLVQRTKPHLGMQWKEEEEKKKNKEEEEEEEKKKKKKKEKEEEEKKMKKEEEEEKKKKEEKKEEEKTKEEEQKKMKKQEEEEKEKEEKEEEENMKKKEEKMKEEEEEEKKNMKKKGEERGEGEEDEGGGGQKPSLTVRCLPNPSRCERRFYSQLQQVVSYFFADYIRCTKRVHRRQEAAAADSRQLLPR